MTDRKSLSRMILSGALVAAPLFANAAIEPPSSGHGELLLTVWDYTQQQSYTRDLGMQLGDVGPADLSDPGFSLAWAPDALLTEFLAGAAGSLVVWNVLAGDSSGPAGARSLLTTAPASFTEAQLEAGNIGDLNRTLRRLDRYVDALNEIDTHASEADGAAVATSGDGRAYAGSRGFGDDLGGFLPFYSNAGVLGQTLNFWQIDRAQPGPANGQGGFFDPLWAFLGSNRPLQFQGLDATPYGLTANGEFLHSTFTLRDDGTLVFAAPVPEAETWALLLVGLSGVAWVARRRRQAAGAPLSSAATSM